MDFRVGFRSLVITVYVFQPLTIFCHKKLNLRCCTGRELNIVTRFTKILQDMSNPMIWRKYEKFALLRCHKNTFPEVFCINGAMA